MDGGALINMTLKTNIDCATVRVNMYHSTWAYPSCIVILAHWFAPEIYKGTGVELEAFNGGPC